DLCSGTGVLAFSLKRAFAEAKVTAVELSPDAFSLLNENAALLCCDINTVCADANAYIDSLAECSVDLIVSNPPYVTEQDYTANIDELCHEPKMAFVAEEDGLYFYRTLIPACLRVLQKGGVLAFEIGEEQGEAVKALFEAYGYSEITLLQDFSGLDRVVYAKKA
ncbi:MAG: peptide chain release factor N(5)-glutamine methyltransferase, partial [Oscillospiraceae bacterium]|nr:peptide chain release factor N(5)-glutamine methyltransferase [Oscillospiraceae bacterium]